MNSLYRLLNNPAAQNAGFLFAGFAVVIGMLMAAGARLL